MTIFEEVEIVEYSPSLFEAVREFDNVSPNDILDSLDAVKNR
jgi:hypothetical protein